MALIYCPECNKQISDNAEYCIHCGFPLLQQYSHHPNGKKNDKYPTKIKKK